MATEQSRTFDLQHGAIYLVVQDKFGSQSHHTLYVTGVDDIDAAIAQILSDTDAQAEVIRQRMIAAGWQG